MQSFLKLLVKSEFLYYFSQVVQHVLLSTQSCSHYVLYLVKVKSHRSAKDPVLCKGLLWQAHLSPFLGWNALVIYFFYPYKRLQSQLSVKEKWPWETFSVNQVVIFSRYMCSKREIKIYNICKVKQNQLSFGKLIFRYPESTHHITFKMCMAIYVFIWEGVRVHVHTYKTSFLCKFLLKTWKKMFYYFIPRIIIKEFFHLISVLQSFLEWMNKIALIIISDWWCRYHTFMFYFKFHFLSIIIS